MSVRSLVGWLVRPSSYELGEVEEDLGKVIMVRLTKSKVRPVGAVRVELGPRIDLLGPVVSRPPGVKAGRRG